MSIIGVFLIHIAGLTYSEEHMNLLAFYIDAFSRFGVPFFFGVLGYMTIVKYSSIENWIPFYKKKLKQLLVPYFAWSILYFFIPVVYPFEEPKKSWTDILEGCSEVHLYFMLPYCTFLLLTPLIVKLYKTNSRKSTSLAAIILICLHIMMLIYSEQAIWHGKRTFYQAGHYSLIIHWMAYYFIGIFVGVNKEAVIKVWNRRKITGKVLSIRTMVYFFTTFLFLATGRSLIPYNTPFLLFNSIVATWWLSAVYEKLKGTNFMRKINFLGKQTFPFYLSHVLFVKLTFIWLFQKEVSFYHLIAVAIIAFCMTLLYMKMEKWGHKKVSRFQKKKDPIVTEVKSFDC